MILLSFVAGRWRRFRKKRLLPPKRESKLQGETRYVQKNIRRHHHRRGTAGSILANRLSADPDRKVLVLEAGAVGPQAGLPDPHALGPVLQPDQHFYNWAYESEPEHFMHNRRIAQPRGKVLGGSSSINGMIHIRGNAMDYEKWGAIKGLETGTTPTACPTFKRWNIG
jgi:choline dehydrogenase